LTRTRFPGSRTAIAIASLAVLVVVLLTVMLVPSSGATGLWIGVHGNHLVDEDGNPVRLLGVDRPGTEYSCLEDGRFFEGPSDSASIKAMKSWDINAVRVPLNESCWLGINGIAPDLGGPAYREAIKGYVDRLESAGLYVILELQWAAPGTHDASGLIPMADAEHAPDFWRSLATEYREDHAVLFDLYNEPHDVSWECWESGCEANDKWFGTYPAVGMSELVEVVRSTGARQPLMLGGLDWAGDFGGWAAHLPADPAHALVASNHTYDFSPCYRHCRAVLLSIATRFPVVTGELGETDCKHDYIDPYMNWADRHDISYLGWGWFTSPEETCENGPSLIENYAGRPSGFGIGLRDHLRALQASGEFRQGTPLG
jgi:endoglucanase